MNEITKESIDALEGKPIRIVIEHRLARQRAYNFVLWMERHFSILTTVDEQDLSTVWITTTANRTILNEAWRNGYTITEL